MVSIDQLEQAPHELLDHFAPNPAEGVTVRQLEDCIKFVGAFMLTDSSQSPEVDYGLTEIQIIRQKLSDETSLFHNQPELAWRELDRLFKTKLAEVLPVVEEV